jgi:hypothetical protein
VKNWVAARNVTFKLYDVKYPRRREIFISGTRRMGVMCKLVKELEKNYIEKERVLDKYSG